MTQHAKGPFDVKIDRQTLSEVARDTGLGRMSLDKRYQGDLDATSQGEMLSAGGTVQGSAGYVAIEHVSGTLQGRKGSFTLMHTGVMTRGTPQLTIMVVPDSGTDQLTGLAGSMSIDMAAGGKHSYTFDYTLPDTP